MTAEQPEVPSAHNLADLVRSAAELRGDGPALASGPATTSWVDLDRLVDAAAAGLQRLGLTVGDRLGTACRTRRTSSSPTSARCAPAWSRCR